MKKLLLPVFLFNFLLAKAQTTDFIIKTEGSVKYVQPKNIKELKENFSFENGIMIKPDGVIVLPSGTEAVLKNGEYLTINGVIQKASDAMLYEVQFKQFNADMLQIKQTIKQLKQDLATSHKKVHSLQKRYKRLLRNK